MLQIHLHRASRALKHKATLRPALLQCIQPTADGLPARPEPVAVVVLCLSGAHAPAVVDHLAGAVASWFEQHRIHGTAWFQSGRPGLHCLGIGHLEAIGIYPGVVAHVLPLERQGLLTAALEHPAKGCRHQRLARST